MVSISTCGELSSFVHGELWKEILTRVPDPNLSTSHGSSKTQNGCLSNAKYDSGEILSK